MLADTRALFFQTELQLPPMKELKISKDQVRGLYNKMFEVGGYPYENLHLQGEMPALSTDRGDGKSLCEFGSHLIRIEEREPVGGVDEFVCVVRTVLGGLGKVSPIYVQRCRVQCVAQPHGSESSIGLLAGKVANVMHKIDPFERPPSYFGVRFRFVPGVEEPEEGVSEAAGGTEPAREAVEHKGFVNLRFETYSKDVKSVWMEVAAVYPFSELIAVPEHLDAITDNILETYRFLAEKSKKFLDQFDVPFPGSEGGG
jgi:hypothetical protein